MSLRSKPLQMLLSDNLESNILINENSSRHIGVSLMNHLRIFIFETDTKCVSIDFINQLISPNGMSIVPANHVLAISLEIKSNYLCIEINSSLFNEEDFRLLLAIKYLKQKQLYQIKNEIITYGLLKNLTALGYSEQTFYHFIRNSIFLRIQNQFGRIVEFNSKYKVLAELFLALVNDPKTFTVNNTCVTSYTEKLNCSEKTLLRCCLSVFHISPQELLKHHLFLNALGWISDFDKPVFNIASRLGYSSQSAFTKFIKSQTSQSLSQIRKQIKDQLGYSR